MAETSDHRQEDHDTAAETDAERPQEATATGIVLAGLFLLLLVGGVAYGVVQLAPEELPTKTDPSFVDTLFDNTVVIAAGRVVLLAMAIISLATAFYILGSIIHRIGKGEWLREAGPFKADVIERKLEETADYFDELVKSEGDMEALEQRLAASGGIIRELLQENEELRQALSDERRTS